MNRIRTFAVPIVCPRVRRAAAFRLLSLVAFVSVVHCGGGDPPAKTPSSSVAPVDTAEESRSPLPAGGSVGAEFGGMNEDKVKRVFESSSDALVACWQDAATGMPYLGGEVKFALEVDTSGKIVSAYVASSTIGDRDAEKCMLGVLRRKSWPSPVGGERGKVNGGLSFDASPDYPTLAWSGEKLAESVQQLAGALEACKNGVTGEFTATAYIGTLRVPPTPEEIADAGPKADLGPREVGKIQSVGIAPPNAQGEAAVDCLVGVLRKGTYPPPGRGPAKVTFGL